VLLVCFVPAPQSGGPGAKTFMKPKQGIRM